MKILRLKVAKLRPNLGILSQNCDWNFSLILSPVIISKATVSAEGCSIQSNSLKLWQNLRVQGNATNVLTLIEGSLTRTAVMRPAMTRRMVMTKV